MKPTTTPDHRLSYELYFAAPAEKVWLALTDGAMTERYFYGTRLEGKLEKGGQIAYLAGDMKMVDGEVLEVERGRRFVTRQRSLWDEKVACDAGSRVAWEITPLGPRTARVTVQHDGFEGETETYRQSAQGWPVILSAMKTLVETGQPLELPAQG